MDPDQVTDPNVTTGDEEAAAMAELDAFFSTQDPFNPFDEPSGSRAADNDRPQTPAAAPSGDGEGAPNPPADNGEAAPEPEPEDAPPGDPPAGDGDGEPTDDIEEPGESETDRPFLSVIDPETGEATHHLTRESAEEGVKELLRHLGRMKRENQEKEEAHRRAIEEREAQITQFQQAMTPEQARESLIAREMPEDLRDLKREDILDQETLSRYDQARGAAEQRVDTRLQEYRQRAQAEREARAAAEADARTHVGSRVRDFDFLGVSNAEDRLAAEERITKRPPDAAEGYETPQQVAERIAVSVSKDAADAYLKGVVSDLRRGRQARAKETLQKAATGHKPRRVAPPAATPPTPPPMSGEDEIEFVLGKNGPHQRKQRI